MRRASHGVSRAETPATTSKRPLEAPAANDPQAAPLRQVPSWDEYFLGIAVAVAAKSKDPRCPVGAVICSEDHIVVSTGFNGLARGVFDAPGILNEQNEKLLWICHAEVNAILNAARVGARLDGCAIFVTKFPCLDCCNAIVQAGIRRVYTHDDAFWDGDSDSCGERKLELIRQTKLQVDAPFHKSFQPKRALKVARNKSVRPV